MSTSMKKIKPTREMKNATFLAGPWYVAKLNHAAMGVFSSAFYPEPNRLGNVYVFVNVDAPVNSKSAKVKILNGKNGIRMLSADVASKCLEVVRKVTKKEQDLIDESIEKLPVSL